MKHCRFLELLSLELHTHNNNGNFDMSSDTSTVDKQLYRTALVQKSGDLGPFYTDLLKIDLNRPIFQKLVNTTCGPDRTSYIDNCFKILSDPVPDNTA